MEGVCVCEGGVWRSGVCVYMCMGGGGYVC